jgi:hypothetical protein
MERLGEEIEAAEDAVEGVTNIMDAKTLSEMEAGIKKQPEIANAVRQAGMAPRDFAKTTLSLVEAIFAYGFLKSGTIKELPKEVNAENVKFIADNEEAIMAIWKGLDGSKKQ